MADQPESSTWESGIFQLELTTPVRGGVGGESNDPLLQLANRTSYLKSHVDTLEAALPLKAPLASPALTGTPTAPTPADGDSSTKLATTAFIQALIRGKLTKALSGGSITLTAIEAGKGLIVFTGTLSSNAIVDFPATPGRWVVANRTSGAFTLQIRASGGTGPMLAQGRNQEVWCDGTDMLQAVTEAADLSLTGTPTAPTAAPTTSTTQLATTAFARRFARGTTTLDASAGGSFTLTDLQAVVPILRLTGSPAAGFTVVLPSEGARWLASNETGQAATLKTSGQTGGVVVAAGRSREVWANGTNIVTAPTEVEGLDLRGTSTAVTPPSDADDTKVVTTEWVRALLAGQALYSTGDLKLTLKAAPDTGWVFLDGKSIGNASSSATAAASAAAEGLFTLLWNNLADSLAPVSGGRGANAAADFAANKRLTLPDTRGRALSGAGQGSGLTNRALGTLFGTETHVLQLSEMPQHDHGGATSGGGGHGHTVTMDPAGFHAHGASISPGGAHGHAAAADGVGDHQHRDGHESFYNNYGGGSLVGNRFYGSSGSPLEAYNNSLTSAAGGHTHAINVAPIGDHVHGIAIDGAGQHAHTASADTVSGHTHPIAAAGSSQAHANVGPSIAFNVMVKL